MSSRFVANPISFAPRTIAHHKLYSFPSRLDRLLVLLDTGSSAAIRTTAAKQLAHLAAKTIRIDVGDDSTPAVSTSTSAAPLVVSSHDEWLELFTVVARVRVLTD